MNNKRVYSTFDGAPRIQMSDAAIGSGLAFLIGELEKRDPKLYEPLTSVTWQRDIVAKTGGGYIEYTSNIFADYATTGGGSSGFIGAETNDIPVMQANITKDNYKVFTWSNILRVPFVAQQLLKQVGRSLDDILDKGIKLNYNKDIDFLVYQGFGELDAPGILNNPNVTAELAPNGASASPAWSTKTADEILSDVNLAITATWIASEYDLTGMANHVLVDPQNYSLLVSKKVSDAGNISTLQYLLDNNIARNQGVDLVIAPSRWCAGAGTSATNRLVAYVNDEDRLCFDLPVPLGRVMTQPSVTDMAYMTAYAAQIGQVKFLFPQTAHYIDGI
jgi:hypothetical protein